MNYKAPGTPRLAGRPAEPGRARAARPNGKPDLSGVWHVQPTSREEMKKLFGNDVGTIEVPGMEIDTISNNAINIFQDLKPADWPVKPAVAEIVARRGDGKPEALPLTYCLPGGLPMSTMLSEVSKIVQAPGLILIMLELGGVRQIYTDGRKHVPAAAPSWLGYSVGLMGRRHAGG